MISPATYQKRRQRLSQRVGGKPILLIGHQPLPRNFLANTYPFRQDSNLLYFTGVSQPGAAVLIQEGGHSTLYLTPAGPDDPLWHGSPPEPSALGAAAGVEVVADLSSIRTEGVLQPRSADPHLRDQPVSDALEAALVSERLCRDPDEIAIMRSALEVTSKAHRLAMQSTHPGVRDTEIQALVEAVFALHGMSPAYGSIITARGEVLHGHASGAALDAGELLLVDAGAETQEGYASDITRTWPVGGRFTPRQRAAYEAVLEANEAAVAACCPGARYREAHLAAAAVIAQFAVDEGLFRGTVDSLVERGVHALLFPHGVGHLIGLDVHDLELHGDLAGYPPDRDREDQFGLSFLRLDRDLEEGMVVTIEPGVYFVPALLADPSLRAKLADAVDWDAVESWLPFGGVRIEDDVLIGADGPEVLSDSIVRSVAEVEALVGSGPTPADRLLGSM